MQKNRMKQALDRELSGVHISKNLKKLEICEAGEGPSSSGVSTSPAEPIPDQNE